MSLKHFAEKTVRELGTDKAKLSAEITQLREALIEARDFIKSLSDCTADDALIDYVQNNAENVEERLNAALGDE